MDRENGENGCPDRYKAGFENAPIGIAISDYDGRFAEVNRAFVTMLGYSRDEAAGLTFMGIMHPDGRAEAERLFGMIRTGSCRTYNGKMRFLTKSGGPLWGTVTVVPRGDGVGMIDCYIGIMDEGDRPSLPETVSTVLESIDADVYVADLKTHEILFMNQSMKRSFGEGLEGEKCWAAFRDADGPCPHCTNPRLLDSSGTPTGLVVWETFNPKTDRWYMNYDRAIRWVDGRHVRLQVAMDVTRMKNLEREILKSEKLESLGVLAGGIAHDFNNLLAAIMGNISLAKIEIDPSSEIHKILDEAERASRRAAGLTKQLLTFSKGGAPVKRMAPLADIVRDSVMFALRGSKHAVEIDIDRDVWPAEVDEGQIAQVVHNITMNAYQALDDSGHISVRVRNRLIGPGDDLPLESGKYIEISIADDGPGIRDDDLPRIFDPYFTTKQGGSGLGLATAFSIVRNHNGHISVHTQFGNGAAFSVFLPASDQMPLDLEFDDDMPAIPAGRNILLMDDDPSNRKVMRRMLEKLGFEVTTVSDGVLAFEAYRRSIAEGRTYDAVILDLTVPGGMGGVETLAGLKEIDPLVKAVVSSGYATDPVMANYRDYGFCGRAAKPYRLDELERILGRVLDG